MAPKYQNKTQFHHIFSDCLLFPYSRNQNIFCSEYYINQNSLETALPVHKKEAPEQFELQPDEEGWLKLILKLEAGRFFLVFDHTRDL